MKKLLYILFFLFSACFSLASYSASSSPSRIYVQTDKEFYMPGELLWFKTYQFSEDLKPVNEGLSYVELYSENGYKILSSKISFDYNSGRGDGTWYLPSQLLSGDYYLIAYNEHLKALGEESFFKKKIKIVSPFDENTVIHQAIAPKLQLKVEGGHLVKGLSSKIAYQVLKNSDQAMFVQIENANGQVLVKQAVSDTGIGFLNFKPENLSYSIYLALPDGQKILGSFPEIRDNGLAFSTEVDELKNWKVILRNSGLENTDKWKIRIQHSGEIYGAKQVRFDEKGEFVHVWSENDLKEGANWIEILDANNSVYGERLILNFKNLFTDSQVKLNKTSLSLREGAELIMSSGTNSNAKKFGAVAILQDISSTLYLPNTYMIPSLWLDREIKNLGIIRNSYFNQVFFNQNLAELDPFLILSERKRVGPLNGKQILEEPANTIKIKFSDPTSRAISNEWVQMFQLGSIGKGYLAQTDEEGIASFKTDPIIGDQQLVVNLQNSRNFKSEILENAHVFKDFNSFINEVKPVFEEILPSIEELKNYHIGVQAQNAYLRKENADFKEITDPFYNLQFFGQTEKTYKLDDYTRFVVMQEVLTEYIPEVNVRSSNSGYYLRVHNPARNLFYNSDPLILLDGIPVQNATNIINYNPLKIESIEVLSSQVYFGENVFDGVVSFKSYSKDMWNDFEDSEFGQIHPFSGYHLSRNYYSPNYAVQDMKLMNIPDYRSTLLWAPISSNELKTIKFSSSDVPATYRVIVEGVDEEGNFIYSQLSFQTLK